jgi:hypothetical protein
MPIRWSKLRASLGPGLFKRRVEGGAGARAEGERSEREEHPHLSHFLGAYLNQDFDLYAPTLDGVVETFIAEEGAPAAAGVRADIVRFRAAHGDDLDVQLRRRHFDYSHEPGQSADEFLTWLDRAMSAGAAMEERGREPEA